MHSTKMRNGPDLPHQMTTEPRLILNVLGWVAMGALLTLVFVNNRAAYLMKRAYVENSDERIETLQSEPEEETIRKCVLPDYPENGYYVERYNTTAIPGESCKFAILNITCQPGFGVLGNEIIFCGNGIWSASMPKCVRFCKLNSHTSVHYQCQVNGSKQGLRDCNDYEPSGTVVVPKCSPNYYSLQTLLLMRCIEGSWDYVAICSPECGRVTTSGNGRSAMRGELPWHVGVYTKKYTPYRQICGGSIVSNDVVISAAHCFWDDNGKKKMPAYLYKVAAGITHRSWKNTKEKEVQTSNITEIMIPDHFQGSITNFQEAIALLKLKTPFEYRTFIRPVCLNFDVNFDQRQLQPGNFGKVAGWGRTLVNDTAMSHVLKVVDLPFVNVEKCIADSPPNFREYITGDKMCAGKAGTALCKGDSGGGLVFPESERGTDRYYLRGIFSVAVNNGQACNNDTLTVFTQILMYENFVMEHL